MFIVNVYNHLMIVSLYAIALRKQKHLHKAASYLISHLKECQECLLPTHEIETEITALNSAIAFDAITTHLLESYALCLQGAFRALLRVKPIESVAKKLPLVPKGKELGCYPLRDTGNIPSKFIPAFIPREIARPIKVTKLLRSGKERVEVFKPSLPPEYAALFSNYRG